MHKYDIILYIKQQLHDDLYSKLAIDKHFCKKKKTEFDCSHTKAMWKI